MSSVPKFLKIVIFYLFFLAGSKEVWGNSIGLAENDEDPPEKNSNQEPIQISALYDYKTGMIFYKDESNKACFAEELGTNGFNVHSTLVIPNDSDLNLERTSLKGKNMNSTLVEAFCGELPIYLIAKFDVNLQKINFPVYESHNRKKRASGGNGQGNRNSGQYWPQQGAASQSQIQGQVSGQGFFSGQAQSQLGGTSQSQVQLAGTGILGSVSSSAGNAQAQIALGQVGGSGQAASSGIGPSNAQVQVNLGQEGRGSMASASVLAGQGGSSSGYGNGQHGWIPGAGYGTGGQRVGSGVPRELVGAKIKIKEYTRSNIAINHHLSFGNGGGSPLGGGLGHQGQLSGQSRFPGQQSHYPRASDSGLSNQIGSDSGLGQTGGPYDQLGHGQGSGLGLGQNGRGSSQLGQGSQHGGSGNQFGHGTGLGPGQNGGSGSQFGQGYVPHASQLGQVDQAAQSGYPGSRIPGYTTNGGSGYHSQPVFGSSVPESGTGSRGAGADVASNQLTGERGHQLSPGGTGQSVGTSQYTPGVERLPLPGQSGLTQSGLTPNEGSVYSQQPTEGLSGTHRGPLGRVPTQTNGRQTYRNGYQNGGSNSYGSSSSYNGGTGYASQPQQIPGYGYTNGRSTYSSSSGGLPHAFASSTGGGQAQAQTVYLGSGTSEFYSPGRAVYGSSSYPGTGRNGNGRSQTQYVTYDTALQNQGSLNGRGTNGHRTTNGNGYRQTYTNGNGRTSSYPGYIDQSRTGTGNGYGLSLSRANGQSTQQSRPRGTNGYATDSGHGLTQPGQSGTINLPGQTGVGSPGATITSPGSGQTNAGNTYTGQIGTPGTYSTHETNGAGALGTSYSTLGQNGSPGQVSSGLGLSSGVDQQGGSGLPRGPDSGGHLDTTLNQSGRGPSQAVDTSSTQQNFKPGVSQGVLESGRGSQGQGGPAYTQPVSTGGYPSGPGSTQFIRRPGDQDGFAPSYGISQVSPDNPDSKQCTIITFSCTIMIESNGRAKICRPTLAQANGNGNGNRGNSYGSGQPQNGAGGICCC